MLDNEFVALLDGRPVVQCAQLNDVIVDLRRFIMKILGLSESFVPNHIPFPYSPHSPAATRWSRTDADGVWCERSRCASDRCSICTSDRIGWRPCPDRRNAAAPAAWHSCRWQSRWATVCHWSGHRSRARPARRRNCGRVDCLWIWIHTLNLKYTRFYDHRKNLPKFHTNHSVSTCTICLHSRIDKQCIWRSREEEKNEHDNVSGAFNGHVESPLAILKSNSTHSQRFR